MATATFHLELKKEPRQDGTHAVRVRITRFRKHAYHNLGKYILSGQWNPSPSPKLHNYVIRHDNAVQINNAIKNALKGLDQVADALPAATAAGIKEAYLKALNPEPEKPEAKGRNFFEFADEYIARLQATNYSTGISFAKHLKEFKAFAGENTAAAVLFSPATLHRFITYLKAKPNAPKTIKGKIVTIRTLYNRSVFEKAILDAGRPFDHVKVVVPKKKKQRPTAAQIKAFIDYQPKTPEQHTAKTVAMMQYLLQGARISEALTLKWSDVQDTYITYLPKKKANRPKFVPRSNMLNKLLTSLPRQSCYVLPCLTDADAVKSEAKLHNRITWWMAKINLALKEIDKELKINIGLSSHMFRHAFADLLIASGANPHTAAAMLGHSSPATSETYFKELQLEDITAFALSIMNKVEGEHSGEQ